MFGIIANHCFPDGIAWWIKIWQAPKHHWLKCSHEPRQSLHSLFQMAVDTHRCSSLLMSSIYADDDLKQNFTSGFSSHFPPLKNGNLSTETISNDADSSLGSVRYLLDLFPFWSLGFSDTVYLLYIVFLGPLLVLLSSTCALLLFLFGKLCSLS